MLKHTNNTMSAGPWYQAGVLAIIICSFFLLQGCVADDSGVSAISDQMLSYPTVQKDLVKPSINPSAKPTIAPIQTKEPDVKPLVDKPSTGPSSTPTMVTSSATVTPGSKGTIIPTQTAENVPSADTYYQWGLAYEKTGNYTAAVEDFDHATTKDPYYANAWYHKALNYEKLGMWDEAYEAYRFLLAVSPGYSSLDINPNLTGMKQNISASQDSLGLVSPPPPRGADFFWFIAGGLMVAGFFGGLSFYYFRHRRKGLNAFVKSPGQTSLSPPDLSGLTNKIHPYYQGDKSVLMTILKISIEIAREGREGKPIGTAFILGDSEAVLERSRQLILNPLAGHSEEERSIMNPDMRENIKELALVDGAFVVQESGVVEAAGRYISIDTSNVKLPRGFGTRHVSVAAITKETDALGIVISESGGAVRVFAKGKMILETV